MREHGLGEEISLCLHRPPQTPPHALSDVWEAIMTSCLSPSQEGASLPLGPWPSTAPATGEGFPPV